MTQHCQVTSTLQHIGGAFSQSVGMRQKVERFVPKTLTLEETIESAVGTTRSTFQCLRFASENVLN